MIFSVVRVAVYVLGIVGTSMAVPLAVACIEGERRMAGVFLSLMIAGWAAAGLFLLRGRRRSQVFDVRNAFGVVGGIWIAVCLFGALPFALSGYFASFTDAVFESVSGFTTTGASVLAEVESLPRSLNLWRCQTHWLGGMGVIALAVALIPLLGVGGFRLIKAETSGPTKSKFTAFVSNTAKTLWLIYCLLTVADAALLHWAGLDVIDAVAHAFSTIGTGGFSTRNGSLGSFALPLVEWITFAFMLLASVNFAVHYRLFTGRFSEVWRDTELRALVVIVVAAIAGIFAIRAFAAADLSATFRTTAFQVASILSTTGFMTCDYLTWLPGAQCILLALFFIGGSSGSTAGGVKVIRWTILAKQLRNELSRILHPHEVISLSVNGVTGREVFVPVVATFVFVYLLLVMVTAFFGTLSGLDLFTSFTGALTMVGNVGPAFGSLGPTSNFGAIMPALKWWYAFAMLAGRLEIYTLLFLIGRMR